MKLTYDVLCEYLAMYFEYMFITHERLCAYICLCIVIRGFVSLVCVFVCFLFVCTLAFVCTFVDMHMVVIKRLRFSMFRGMCVHVFVRTLFFVE